MQSNAAFTVYPTTVEETTIDGVTHTRIVGTIENDQGQVSDQVINVLSGNPRTNANLHVIAADNYPATTYGTANLLSIIGATNNRYDNYEVIGGINGDYYNMVVGIPVGAYIRNYEVLSSGLGYGRPVIGFKDSGEVIIDTPCFEGFHVLIQSDTGRLKQKLRLDRINGLPYSNEGVSVFFGDHTQTIPSDLPKMIIDTTEFKTDGYQTRYFGKGSYVSQTTNEITVPGGSFVLVSNDRYIYEWIDEGDIVIVQEQPACGFEDVRFALGTWEELVVDGVAVNSMSTGTAPAYPNPRTAIGLKDDGTVLLVTIDGRQSTNGMDGMTLYEVADLLVSLGATTGYALDGGGSTTMALSNGSGSYAITNSPSDGGLRNLSNAIFFVSGTHQSIPEPYPMPDLSTPLPVPTGIHIDREGTLRFDRVDDADGYEIEINGVVYPTLERSLPLNLEAGTYDIRIRAIGDGRYHGDSPFSGVLSHVIYEEDIEVLIELFRNIARNETK
jgi:hypothetical protein